MSTNPYRRFYLLAILCFYFTPCGAQETDAQIQQGAWRSTTNITALKYSHTPRQKANDESNASLTQMSAENDSTNEPKIKLKKSFFKGWRFTFGNDQPKKVYDWFGASFHPEFQEVMALHPASLREAKKSYPYNALANAVAFAIVGLTLKNFFDTMNQAQTLSRGEYPDSGFELSSLIQMTYMAAVVAVSSRLGHPHLKKGVNDFNQRQEGIRPPISSTIRSRFGTLKTKNDRSGTGEWGFKFGMNVATITGGGAEKINSKTRLSYGFFWNRRLNNKILLHPEVLFSMKGCELNDSAVNLNYLDVHMLTQLALPSIPGIQPAIIVGPSLGLKLNSNIEEFGEKKQLDTAKSIVFDGHIGVLGRIGDSPLSFEIRYGFGLTSAFKDVQQKNRLTTVALGYKF